MGMIRFSTRNDEVLVSDFLIDCSGLLIIMFLIMFGFILVQLFMCSMINFNREER